MIGTQYAVRSKFTPAMGPPNWGNLKWAKKRKNGEHSPSRQIEVSDRKHLTAALFKRDNEFYHVREGDLFWGAKIAPFANYSCVLIALALPPPAPTPLFPA